MCSGDKKPAGNAGAFPRTLRMHARISARQNRICPCQWQGQPYPVIVHHLVVLGGTDEDVIKSLGGKANAQDSLLEALKVRIQKAKKEAAA